MKMSFFMRKYRLGEMRDMELTHEQPGDAAGVTSLEMFLNSLRQT